MPLTGDPPAPDLNGSIGTTTNSTGVLSNMFTPIVHNGTVTVVPSNNGVHMSHGQYMSGLPQGAPGWPGNSGSIGSSGYQGYNMTGHPDQALFKTYIKQLEGQVLVCEEKIEDEKFVVPVQFAMRFLYQFLEQVPFIKTLDNLDKQPINDEIHRVYWRKAKKDERCNALFYDEVEIDAFIEDAKEYMNPLYPHGISGASPSYSFQNSLGSTIMCSGVSNLSMGAMGFSIGSGLGAGIQVDPQGNVTINGPVTINGTLTMNNPPPAAQPNQFLTTCQANENGDIMTWAGGGTIN